ncbi:hypothetical protein [Paludibacterium purpuratum]|nr:hypothetical protein [Paludibacterium purpuratum]
MSTKPKRTARPARNPLLMIAGKQRIGRDDADRLLFPLAAHLYEVAAGQGYAISIRVVTLFAAAAYDAALYYKHDALKQIADKAGDMWIAGAQRCADHGIADRVVLTGDELRAARLLVRALNDLLPGMEVAAWRAFVDNARRRWAQYATDSVFAWAA